jgi:hypothetical protein
VRRKAKANGLNWARLLKPMALETDTFTGINKDPLSQRDTFGEKRGTQGDVNLPSRLRPDFSGRGDDHLQIVSEDDLRGV